MEHFAGNEQINERSIWRALGPWAGLSAPVRRKTPS